MTQEEMLFKVENIHSQIHAMTILPEQQIKVMALVNEAMGVALERGFSVVEEVREEVLSDLKVR